MNIMHQTRVAKNISKVSKKSRRKMGRRRLKLVENAENDLRELKLKR
jgi:hypothetical protein